MHSDDWISQKLNFRATEKPRAPGLVGKMLMKKWTEYNIRKNRKTPVYTFVWNPVHHNLHTRPSLTETLQLLGASNQERECMVHSASLSAFRWIDAFFFYFSTLFFKELSPNNTEVLLLLEKDKSRMTEGMEKNLKLPRT